MPTYMVQGNYTSESWKGQVSNPIDRIEIARAAIAGFGGKLVVDYYAFGDYDFVLIMEMPNNESAAGFVMAIASNHRDIPIPQKTVVIGEVGLGGEIRPVTHIDRRLREA